MSQRMTCDACIGEYHIQPPGLVHDGGEGRVDIDLFRDVTRDGLERLTGGKAGGFRQSRRIASIPNTCAPCAPSPSAMPRPMPLPSPVTMMTRPDTSNSPIALTRVPWASCCFQRSGIGIDLAVKLPAQAPTFFLFGRVVAGGQGGRRFGIRQLKATCADKQE